MKALSLMFLLALATLVGACATTAQPTDGKLANAYMQAVESQAEKRPIKIYWVNPPSERTLQRRYGKSNDH